MDVCKSSKVLREASQIIFIEFISYDNIMYAHFWAKIKIIKSITIWHVNQSDLNYKPFGWAINPLSPNEIFQHPHDAIFAYLSHEKFQMKA